MGSNLRLGGTCGQADPALPPNPDTCNLFPPPALQPPAMTLPGTGVVTLQRETTGRSDTDAVDATLAASGDAHAFERLYRGHLSRIFSLARRMLGDEDADDVIQDVFVRAWQ